MVLKYVAKTDITWRTNDEPVKEGIAVDRKKLKPAMEGKYNAVLWKAGEEVDPAIGMDLAVNSRELVEVVEEKEVEKTVEKVKATMRARKTAHGYRPE